VPVAALILMLMGIDPGINTSTTPLLIPGSSPGMTGDARVSRSGDSYQMIRARGTVRRRAVKSCCG